MSFLPLAPLSLLTLLMNTDATTFIPLAEARPDQFLCQYQTHCFSLASAASSTRATVR